MGHSSAKTKSDAASAEGMFWGSSRKRTFPNPMRSDDWTPSFAPTPTAPTGPVLGVRATSGAASGPLSPLSQGEGGPLEGGAPTPPPPPKPPFPVYGLLVWGRGREECIGPWRSCAPVPPPPPCRRPAFSATHLCPVRSRHDKTNRLNRRSQTKARPPTQQCPRAIRKKPWAKGGGGLTWTAHEVIQKQTLEGPSMPTCLQRAYRRPCGNQSLQRLPPASGSDRRTASQARRADFGALSVRSADGSAPERGRGPHVLPCPPPPAAFPGAPRRPAMQTLLAHSHGACAEAAIPRPSPAAFHSSWAGSVLTGQSLPRPTCSPPPAYLGPVCTLAQKLEYAEAQGHEVATVLLPVSSGGVCTLQLAQTTDGAG